MPIKNTHTHRQTYIKMSNGKNITTFDTDTQNPYKNIECLFVCLNKDKNENCFIFSLGKKIVMDHHHQQNDDDDPKFIDLYTTSISYLT